MTNTVVTDAQNTIVQREPETTVIVVGATGPRGANGAGSFSQMTDIDLSTLQAGSLLVYNTTTSKWTSTTQLNQQSVDCGEF